MIFLRVAALREGRVGDTVAIVSDAVLRCLRGCRNKEYDSVVGKRDCKHVSPVDRRGSSAVFTSSGQGASTAECGQAGLIPTRSDTANVRIVLL